VSPLSYLKPSESLTEIVAGLIVVLSFTLAASVLSGGEQEGARAALLGAIGCNAAWGIIDAVFYMMASTFDRNGTFASPVPSLPPRTRPRHWRRSGASSTPIWHR
jgi:hypothetical protein